MLDLLSQARESLVRHEVVIKRAFAAAGTPLQVRKRVLAEYLLMLTYVVNVLQLAGVSKLHGILQNPNKSNMLLQWKALLYAILGFCNSLPETCMSDMTILSAISDQVCNKFFPCSLWELGSEHIYTSAMPKGHFFEATGHLHLDPPGLVTVSSPHYPHLHMR